jgi:hypothetical protein
VTPCSDAVGHQRRHDPEDLDLNLHRRENLKSRNDVDLSCRPVVCDHYTYSMVQDII